MDPSMAGNVGKTTAAAYPSNWRMLDSHTQRGEEATIKESSQ